MLALIDGDILCYSLAAVGEIHTHTYTLDGKILWIGNSRLDGNRWLNEQSISKSCVEIATETVYRDFSYIESTGQVVLDSILEKTGCDTGQLWLTSQDKSCFRYKIYPKYKAGRPIEKPFYFYKVREWFLSVYKAEEVFGIEADDALGIAASTTGGIICSLDKDLDTIPGEHYNWKKGIRYSVDEYQAAKNLYTQLVVGDRVDNIKGIPHIGEARAARLLEGLSVEKMRTTVKEIYKHTYGSLDLFSLNEKLVTILRRPLEETWPNL